jgi:nitrogen fixation protein
MLRKAIESVGIPKKALEEPLWTSCSDDEMAKLCGIR